MLNKQDYQAAFSKVTASGETYRRVMNMTKYSKRKSAGRRVAVLIAAVIALMAIAVTAFASEYVQNWFASYFAEKGDAELSQTQVEFIEANVQNINDVQTQDGWTVELRSAITDGTTAYIVFYVKGPEDIDLTDWTDDQGNVQGQILFGNEGMPGYLTSAVEYFTFPEEVTYGCWGETWLEDGDGLCYTKNLLITLSPDMTRSRVNPFGSEAVYQFRFENIVWSYTDTAYEQELREGKYAGKDGVMYTEEEIKRIYRWDVLAEGVWEFDISFALPEDGGEYVELLTSPVSTTASIFRRVGEEITDYVTVEETVTLTSVQLRHLSVTFTYAECNGAADFDFWEGDQVTRPRVVLKDGTVLMLLPHGNTGNGSVTMETEQPIVFEDVAYILMADGTIIEMPE